MNNTGPPRSLLVSRTSPLSDNKLKLRQVSLSEFPKDLDINTPQIKLGHGVNHFGSAHPKI